MTRVCLLGDPDVNLRYELLSRETARRALMTYDLREPFQNAVAVETVSLGAAVSLLNDLNWYIVRFVADCMVLEPSVSETEWLSRALATAIRDDDRDPAASGRYLKVYGVEPAAPDADRAGAPASSAHPDDSAGAASGPDDDSAGEAPPPRLVEPMFVTRTGDTLPEYDLRDVQDTLRVRVTKSEFGA